MIAHYVALLICWSSLNMFWLGTLVFAGFSVWKRIFRPQPEVLYRAAVVALSILLASFVLYGVAAHLALLQNAKSGREGALLAMNTATPQWIANIWEATFNASTILTGVWIGGGAIILLRLLLAKLGLRRILRNCSTVDASAFQRVQQFAREFGVSTPHVLISGSPHAPFVTGIQPGTLVLPAHLPQGDEWDVLVLHELAHLARRDATGSIWLQILRGIVWFQPAIWFLFNDAVQSREEACDDASVARSGNAFALASALVKLEERRAHRAAVLSANGGSLTRRVRRLLGLRHISITPERIRSHQSSVALATFLILAVGGVVCSTHLAPTIDHLAVSGALSGVLPSLRTDITAQDPAGNFTVLLLNGRVAGATVGEVPIAATAIRRQKNTVSISDARGEPLLAMELDPVGRIRWEPRER